MDSDPTGRLAPGDALAAVVALRRLADRLEADAVTRALAEGWSLVEAAEALGVTKQAVHKKHRKPRQL